MRPTVAVVGGGVTGLAAAHALATADDPPHVVVLEASPRLGGKVRTEPFAGVPVDTGPDSMLARVPWAAELCRRIGLADRLVPPATGRAYLWSRGRLRPLPDGLVLGVPASLTGVVRAGVLSPAGVARAALDLTLPRRPAGDDPSVADVVGGRFGAEVVDRLVEPLVGGINAGRADRLSLAATAPDVAAAARSGRSLLLALRARRRAFPPDPSRPVFLGLAGGLSVLVDRLADAVGAAGGEVRLSTPVVALADLEAGAVVLTTPAPAAAALLEPVSPEAAGLLRAVGHASVAVVTLAYDAAAVRRPLDGSGFLVPRAEGRLVTACTWLSSKWPALAVPGLVLVRASVGRAGDERFAAMDDAALVDAVHAELAEALDLTARPVERKVTRWPGGFPQYDVGHLARVAAVEAALARDAPRLTVAGAPYRGLGLAACVRQGQEAAARALLAAAG